MPSTPQPVRSVPAWRRQTGATAVEYAIMLAAIAALVVGIVIVLGQQTNELFECTEQSISTGTSACSTS